jgi:hypothetical protein
MPSVIYTRLQNNITQLVAQFRDFNRVDASLPPNQIKLRALISLIHAEFETYFEQVGNYIIDFFQNGTMTTTQSATIKGSILCYGNKSYEGGLESYFDRINSNVLQLKSIISSNNGIKEKDILKIILPLSFPVSLLDQTWLNTINSFGSLRGELIHRNLNQISRVIGYDYFDAIISTIVIPGINPIDQYFVTNFNLP